MPSPRRALLVSVVAVAASLALAGCRRQDAPSHVSAAAPVGSSAPTEPTEPATGPAAAHGTRKLMNLDAPVFVDGGQIAVLRFGDLPVLPREVLEGGTPAFRLHDYLTAIGVPMARLRSVHLHGNGDRIASVSGAELRREPRRFSFAFASGTTGTAVQRWSTEGLANGFVVHEIRKVSVFVEKVPAPLHPTRKCHLDGNGAGACTDAVPYASGEPAKGTRILVDGRMVGAVKRRLVGEALALGAAREGEDATFSVAKLAGSFGVPPSGVKAVELVSGDEVVARANAEQWARLAGSLAFTLPRHQHGKVTVRVPRELQATGASADAEALVSAVIFYRATTPMLGDGRELARISEDTDLAVRLAAVGPTP